MARLRLQRFRRPGARTFNAVLEANEGALAVFRKRERNRVVKLAMSRAGRNWRAEFMWKRFKRAIVLSYPFNYKGDRGTPLVGWHKGGGALQNSIYSGRVITRKRQGTGGFSTSVALLNRHPISVEIVRVLQTVPGTEVEWMVDNAAEGIASLIGAATLQSERREKRARERRNRQRREAYRRRRRAQGNTVRTRRGA